MLQARVYTPLPPNPAPEDFFASGLSALFTDDTQNSHGVPGQSVIYSSPKFGDIKLGIPAHPDREEGRTLFAHYLWNAGVLASDAIETASSQNDDSGANPDVAANEDNDDVGKVNWDRKYWDVRDRDVLEVGSGTALPSLISALSGARSITITDHPTSPALVTGAIARNVLETLKINLLSPTRPCDAGTIITDTTPASNDSATASISASPQRSSKDSLNPTFPPPQPYSNNNNNNNTAIRQTHPRTRSHVSIHALTWGTPAFTSATTYGKMSDPQPEPASFDKIIVSDCLWMTSQHSNLVKTIGTYLQRMPSRADADANGDGSAAPAPTATSVPCALVVAGFHTGRDVVARFFRIATGRSTMRRYEEAEGEENEEGEDDDDEDEREVKGSLHAAEMIEVDIDRNVRPWMPKRPGESREQAKRWCVCAALVRR